MADVVLAKSGYPIILAALLGDLNVYVHLYTNDPALTDALTPAAFTEPVYSGYQALPASKWSPSALRGNVAVAVADPVEFAYTSGAAPDPIRGYYATDGPGGVLLWAWRRPGDAFPLGPSAPVLLVAVRATFPAPCP